MNKLAVFVEGKTELLFVDRLISEIAGSHNVLIEQRMIRGGSNVPRKMYTIKAGKPTGQKYYVLLFDCGSDDQVKSRILEEHENLTRSGYTKIIGMRDVRPTYSYNEISKLETNLKKYVKTSLIPVEFVLAIMEIEAWFLAEFNHFSKIDSSITMSEIKTILGFDPVDDDMSLRPNPTEDLNNAYIIGGKNYVKGSTTLDVLDYAYIYLELSKRIPYLQRLRTNIDDFLS